MPTQQAKGKVYAPRTATGEVYAPRTSTGEVYAHPAVLR